MKTRRHTVDGQSWWTCTECSQAGGSEQSRELREGRRCPLSALAAPRTDGLRSEEDLSR